MNHENQTFMERVKKRRDKTLSSPEFAKEKFFNRQIAKLVLVTWPFVFLFTYLSDKILGISAYIGSTVFMLLGITFVVLVAQKWTQDKLKRDD